MSYDKNPEEDSTIEEEPDEASQVGCTGVVIGLVTGLLFWGLIFILVMK